MRSRKTEDEPRYAAYAEDFPWFIRTNSKDAPGVVLADRSKAKAEDGYGGRWAALCVNPYAFEHPTGGKFANLGLVHAQLLDHDEPIGRYVPAVDDVFEAVEGDGSDIFA